MVSERTQPLNERRSASLLKRAAGESKGPQTQSISDSKLRAPNRSVKYQLRAGREAVHITPRLPELGRRGDDLGARQSRPVRSDAELGSCCAHTIKALGGGQDHGGWSESSARTKRPRCRRRRNQLADELFAPRG